MTPLSALSPRGLVRILAHLFLGWSLATSLAARDEDPTAQYLPQIKLIEGDQPLNTSYVLSITSPTNVVAGSNVAVSLSLAVNAMPTGVSSAAALSFVSLSTTTLVFTGPSQVRNVTVTISVPEGTAAGDYQWAITANGWPAGTVASSGLINAKVTIPQVPFPPSISLSAPVDGSVINQPYSALPLALPISFVATAPSISPITSIDADINGTALTLSATGLGTASVQASGSIPVTQAGIFTVRARATNNVGTSTDTAEITVNIQAPAPTVMIAQPTASSFVYAGSTLTIPYSFTGTSLFGGVSALAATLNGTPLSVTRSGLGSLAATGTGNLVINGAGSYTLAVTATSANGTSSATKTFTVTAAQSVNAPTVAISQPLDGATFTRVAGSAPTVIPFAFTAAADTGSNITSVAGTLNGSVVAVTVTGLDSGNAAGSGNFSLSTPGTYTFVATANAGTLSGSSAVSFTVTETAAPTADCTIEWLPPISLGKVQKGGSVLPIKFRLDCGCRDCADNRGRKNDCEKERDTTVVIAIYEIFANGSMSAPELFTYSRHGNFQSRDGTYAINGNHYQLNYDTPAGAHRFHIDVYRAPQSAAPVLLGTKEFTTR